MVPTPFVDRVKEILDIANDKGNVCDLALLVAYGGVMQSASDYVISRAQAIRLLNLFPPNFEQRYEDPVEVAVSGLTVPQLEALAVD